MSLKCDLDSVLTPSPASVVVVGELLGRGSEIGEQAAQRFCTLHADERAKGGAVVHVHGLHGVAIAPDHVHANVARREPRAGRQDAAALRIPLTAGFADDLVGVVTEPLAGWQCATGMAVEHEHRVGTLTRLLLRFSRLGYDPIPPED